MMYAVDDHTCPTFKPNLWDLFPKFESNSASYYAYNHEELCEAKKQSVKGRFILLAIKYTWISKLAETMGHSRKKRA